MSDPTTVTFGMIAEIAFNLVGGLSIFLLGMKNMSEGMQAVAGDRLRRLIAAVTSNRFLACLVGVSVTCVVQSSSITTVMVVGLVQSGFMTLSQAVGVIIGANIGTTITGWVLVLKIGKYGLPLLGIAGFLYLFARSDRWKFTGMALMGVGMAFFGLELMSGGLKPLGHAPEFVAWFARFQAHDYTGMWRCVLVGCVVTCILQSSSATLAITISLAEAGLIEFRTAAALILGENIGTTITAYLASLGASANARRAAYSHIIFNVLGVLWITSLFAPYMHLITHLTGGNPDATLLVGGETTYPGMRRAIALTHSGFNIANTLLFLPLLPLLTRLASRMVPEPAGAAPGRLEYFDARLMHAPALGIQQSAAQIQNMGRSTERMMEIFGNVLAADQPNEPEREELLRLESELDNAQRDIVEFLGRLLSDTVPHEVAVLSRQQFRMAHEYESLSDQLANLVKLQRKLERGKLALTTEAQAELNEIHRRAADLLLLVNEHIRSGRTEGWKARMEIDGPALTRCIKQSRNAHLERVTHRDIHPMKSLVFADMLTCYRKIKDHCVNVTEAVLGEI